MTINRLDDAPTVGHEPGRRRHGRALAVLAVALVLAVAARRSRRGPRGDRRDRGAAGRRARRDRVLHYPIPRGQDPAAAMSALRVQGYAVQLHAEGTDYEVEIRAGDDGYVDREHVRGILQRSSLDLAGKGSLDEPVRFTDE